MCSTRPGLRSGHALLPGRAAPGFEDALTILDFSPTQDVRRRGRARHGAGRRAAEGRAHAVAPAVARHPGRARPGLRSDGIARASAAGGDARRRRCAATAARSMRGGTRSGSTAPRGGVSGSAPGEQNRCRRRNAGRHHVLAASLVIARWARWNSHSSSCRYRDAVRASRSPIRALAERVAEGAHAAEITAILDRSCRDCHSNDTRWPWYTQRCADVMVRRRPRQSRPRALQLFASGPRIDAGDQDKLLGEMCSLAQRGADAAAVVSPDPPRREALAGRHQDAVRLVRQNAGYSAMRHVPPPLRPRHRRA